MNTVTLTINGKPVTTRADATILETVREQGLDPIPTLCHSPELAPYGSCFLCVVEVKGRANLVPACATRVADKMDVETHNDRIRAARKTALELLISNHYADCLPPCRLGCPAGVDTQGYIALSAMGNYRQALDLIRRNNPLPAVCGRICVRKCEIECRRNAIDKAVNINAVKRFLSDVEGAYDDIPENLPQNGKSVGIIGAGPAGLTAAWFLAGFGYKTIIYESMERTGGMLRYGIPVYRLPDDVLDREIDYIRGRGVDIQCSTRVGKDITLGELRNRHDALFIATGAWTAKPMELDGEFTTEGVVDGIEFLRKMADNPVAVTGIVAVVGGGNTAMDVARTAWRLGAAKVMIVYRRTKAEMPADPLELADCLREGVELMELTAPVAIEKQGNRLVGLRCIRMELGEPDASGRRRPVPIKNSEFILPCDTAVTAIGQSPALDGLLSAGDADIALTKRHTVAVDTTRMTTSIEGIFAGGDAADDGPTVVVDAIRDGRRAALSIDAYLSGREIAPEPFAVRKDNWGKVGTAELEEVRRSERHEAHEIDVEKRRHMVKEVSLGLREEEMKCENTRCLSCGCIEFDECDLRRFAEEYGVDPLRFAGRVKKNKIDDRHPSIIYDPNKCILCTRCVRTCDRILPQPALGLTGRGFNSEIRPSMNDPLIDTNCIGCGNCIDACPTAALTEKYFFSGRAALNRQNVATRCALCSMACAITVHTIGNRNFFIRSTVPGGYICRYGRFGPGSFDAQKRLIAPVVRDGERRHTATMDEAIARSATAFKAAVKTYGAEAVAVFVSGELTNEELYCASLIAREGFATNNISSLSLLLHGGRTGQFDRSFGFTASTADRDALADADLIVCSNTDLLSDHLILSVHVTEAVRRGARLITLNSAPSSANAMPQALSLDPLRGTATLLWAELLRHLLNNGHFNRQTVARLSGGEEFLRELDSPDGTDSFAATGVTAEKLHQVVDLFRTARSIVFIHSPDREIDCAPFDCEMLANFILLLRAHDARAELILPRLIPNGAGMEIMGVDPMFLPGKTKPGGLPGAANNNELLQLLHDGRIRAALIIGEDPFYDETARGFFRNTGFIAAMDWKMTETTHFADVALPGTLFLESSGTRCNFEGIPVTYSSALEAPSGIPGWKVLYKLAAALDVRLPAPDFESLAAHLDSVIRSRCGHYTPFYWNTNGEKRIWNGTGKLVAVAPHVETTAITPYLTHTERYRKMLREITGHHV